MKKGFATIYIVLILSSLILAILVITEVSEGFGSKSVSESIVTSAGQSVLGEYNKALFERYGIFALRNYDNELEDRIKHYINGSTMVTKGFIKLKLEDAFVYSDMYPALNTTLFSKEIRKVVLESVLKRTKTSETHVEHKVPLSNLPSKLLGYSSREFLLLSGGLFEIQLDKYIEDEYISNMCSCKTALMDTSYLAYEIEYILFGYNSDDKNLASCRRSLYELRFAENLAQSESLPTDPVALAVATAKAATKAEADVDALVNGERIDGLDYTGYLQIFLSLLSRDEKLARLMDIMQINLNCMDGITFSFSHYSFGFDLVAKFEKKVIVPIYWGYGQRYRTVEQTHVYR